jgi:uncharacterized protein (DUF952 family)
MIYHITTRQAWKQAKAEGAYTADSLKSEGFIHCSTAAQVQATANRFFHGSQDLVLLHIDDLLLGSALIYENLEGGTELFPHLYTVLPLGAIREVQNLPPNADGGFEIIMPSH